MPPLAARHPEMQTLRRLLRRRSARSESARYVIEGPRLVVEAIDAGVTLDAVYVPTDAEGADLADLADRCARAGIAPREVAAGVIEQVASTQSPQPALALAVPRPATLRDALALPRTLLLVLHDVADPGNAGTLMRVAEAVGGGVVLCGPAAVDAYNPKVVRAAAGSLFRIPVAVEDDLTVVLAACRTAGVRTVATSLGGTDDYDALDLTGPVALVLGNEAHGLPAGVLAEVDRAVRIPMLGSVESLNVAMAGAVIAFEAARQRRAAPRRP
jgi:TrmH family RNA methyltransferase